MATEVDGVKFQSKRESRRWSELKLLERAGEIVELERQVKYELTAPRGFLQIHVGFYIADFRYFRRTVKGDAKLDELVVEDAKGWRTDLYAWKIRHVKAQYGIVVAEV